MDKILPSTLGIFCRNFPITFPLLTVKDDEDQMLAFMQEQIILK